MAFHQVKCYNSLCSSIDWHIPECCCLWYAMKRFHSSLYLLFSESFSIEEFHSNISECFINTPIWVSFNCHFASFLSRWAANRHFMGHFPCFECCLRGLFLSCFPHGKISLLCLNGSGRTQCCSISTRIWINYRPHQMILFYFRQHGFVNLLLTVTLAAFEFIRYRKLGLHHLIRVVSGSVALSTNNSCQLFRIFGDCSGYVFQWRLLVTSRNLANFNQMVKSKTALNWLPADSSTIRWGPFIKIRCVPGSRA